MINHLSIRSIAVIGLTLLVGLAIGVLSGATWHEPIHAWSRGKASSHADHVASSESSPKQLWTCGMHPQVIKDKPGTCPICHMALEPVREAEATSDHTLVINPVMVQNMGVRTTQVTQGPLRRRVRAVGVIGQPQPRLHEINLRVGGWVEKLYADTEGMLVRKGQPLFELYSPEVLVAVGELISAQRNLDRLGDQAGDSMRQSAGIMREAAARKLELWGLDNEQIEALGKLDEPPRTITFFSSVTAEVSEKMVVQGAAVTAGQSVLRLADRSVVWLDAQVFTQDMPFVGMDQPVTATIESFPGKEFSGKVIHIHPRLDTVARTAKVRIELDNAELLLRPGMFATVRTTAELDEHAILVPDEAVIDTGERQLVFVSLGEGKFEPRSIQTGLANADGTVQVLHGLVPDETVVTSGQFLLDTESRTREAIRKYRSQGAAVPPRHQH